jgi:ferredoxin
MLNISTILAGVAFVMLAATNVVVMLEASQPLREVAMRNHLIAIHRTVGYLFVTLLCIMAYSMSQRLAGVGITGHLSTHLVLHIVLVLVLVPLLLLKILIARRYKQSHSLLKALGLAIFAISFVLVSIPVFSEFLRSAHPGSLGLKLAIGSIVAVCLVQGALVFKKRPLGASAGPSRIPEIPALPTPLTNSENAKGSMNLLLARIEQQTHDTRTLRFQVSAGSTLLDLAEKNSVQIPYGCRQGLCGTCATRVLSGTVQMDVEAGLTAEQKNAGYVLPCVSRAEGTVVLAV